MRRFTRCMRNRSYSNRKCPLGLLGAPLLLLLRCVSPLPSPLRRNAARHDRRRPLGALAKRLERNHRRIDWEGGERRNQILEKGRSAWTRPGATEANAPADARGTSGICAERRRSRRAHGRRLAASARRSSGCRCNEDCATPRRRASRKRKARSAAEAAHPRLGHARPQLAALPAGALQHVQAQHDRIDGSLKGMGSAISRLDGAYLNRRRAGARALHEIPPLPPLLPPPLPTPLLVSSPLLFSLSLLLLPAATALLKYSHHRPHLYQALTSYAASAHVLPISPQDVTTLWCESWGACASNVAVDQNFKHIQEPRGDPKLWATLHTRGWR